MLYHHNKQGLSIARITLTKPYKNGMFKGSIAHEYCRKNFHIEATLYKNFFGLAQAKPQKLFVERITQSENL